MTPELWAVREERKILVAFGIMPDTFARPEGLHAPKDFTSIEAWNASKIQTLAEMVRERFSSLWTELDDLGQERDVQFLIWDSRRSLTRQLELYKRGRLDKGEIVTWTIASNHLWGTAIDVITCNARTKAPVFAHPKWWVKDALPLAKKHGLSSLYLTKGIDPAHIELSQTKEIRDYAKELKTSFAKVWKGQGA